MTVKYAARSIPREARSSDERDARSAQGARRATTRTSHSSSGHNRRPNRRRLARLSEKPTGMRSSPWRLLGDREFRHYFLSSTCSNAGTWLQSTAQVILAFQLTHSVFFVGLIVALQFAGVPFLSPVAAMLASRHNGRQVLLITQAGSAVVAALMAGCYFLGLLDRYSAFPLAAGALLLGIGYSLALPVQVTLVPSLVRKDEAEAALRMNSASYNGGRAFAPILSVLIIATIGPGWIFALNSVTFALFAFTVSRLKPASPEQGRTWLRSDRKGRPRITDGLAITRQHPRILLLLAFVAAITLADDPIQVLSPSLTSAMKLSHDWTGLFIAALGWGAVAGSMLPRSFARSRAKGTSKQPAQDASKRAAWWLLALAVFVLLYVLGLSPIVSLAAAAGTGIAALIAGTAAQTPIMVSDHQDVASVTALWAIAWAGTKPVASLLDGWLAGTIGIKATALVLVLPAAFLAGCELTFPRSWRDAIKDFSKTRLAHL
jgi:MFS family permease